MSSFSMNHYSELVSLSTMGNNIAERLSSNEVLQRTKQSNPLSSPSKSGFCCFLYLHVVGGGREGEASFSSFAVGKKSERDFKAKCLNQILSLIVVEKKR